MVPFQMAMQTLNVFVAEALETHIEVAYKV